jgi:hypothetical protein
MRRVIFIFGFISGAVLSAMFLIGVWLCQTGVICFMNELMGWASIVLSLSMIFFGIKSYRDNYQKGVITFWKGLQIGLLITLIASVLYAAAGELLYLADPTAQAAMMDKLADYNVNKLKESGASAAEIDKKAREMADLKTMTESAFLRFVFTLVLVMPVGIVISLLSASLLRRKELLPA